MVTAHSTSVLMASSPSRHPQLQRNRPSRRLRSAAALLIGASLPLLAVPAVQAQVGMPNPLPENGRDSRGPQQGPLFFPQRGVVCDQGTSHCYDNRGLSARYTGMAFGERAERRVRRELGGLPAPSRFILSNGAACDINRATCWRDGWGRREVAPRLTSELFGNTPSPGPTASSCQLNRGFRTSFRGPCTMRRDGDGWRRRYIIELGSGVRYTFINQDGGFRITDGSGGNWPVQYNRQGNSVMFSWADLSLQVTRSGWTGQPRLGESLGSLLDSLFN